MVFVGTFVCVKIPPPNCTPLIPCPPCSEGKPSPYVNPLLRCPPPPPPKTCTSKFYTGPCPPIDPNAYTKCISAALVAKDDKGGLACARLLPDTPDNAYTKCISEALINDDTVAGLKCAPLLPSVNGASNNLTNTTTAAATPPPCNKSAAIQPTNTSIPASGGPGTGSTCINNCTTGTSPPLVDCTKNPNDPSCTQTLTPPTITPPSTSVPPTSPTTKTCPDGSVIDASATCPTPSTIPNTPPPPSSSTPPPHPPSRLG